MIGETIEGRYLVESRLGAGGMATVYLAIDSRMSRRVVIKVPDPTLLADETFRERFEREKASLVALTHPHVVTVIDAGQHGDLPYLVLEYLEGGSLSDRIDAAGGSLRPSHVASWILDVAGALDFIHAQKVIHRDVKPGNILFDAHGHVFLADFGIAKATASSQSDLTLTGMLPGTPDYMAPEAGLRPDIDGRADQYALASVIYRALGRGAPHRGDSPLAVMIAKQTAVPEDLRSVAPNVPPLVADVVMRGLERDPDDRFESCGAFARAFRQALAKSTESTQVAAKSVRPKPARPAKKPKPAEKPKPAKPSRAPEAARAARPVPPGVAPRPRRTSPWTYVFGFLTLGLIPAIVISFRVAILGPRSRGRGKRFQRVVAVTFLAGLVFAGWATWDRFFGGPGVPLSRPFYEDATITRFGALMDRPGWVRDGQTESGCYRAYHETTGLTFVLAPAGTVEGANGERIPIEPFLVSTTECTVEAWRRGNGSDDDIESDADDHPARPKNFEAADIWCFSNGLAIPRDYEWEHAALQGDDGFRYCYGFDREGLDHFAWFDDNASSPEEVATRRPNGWGLYDFHGNVAEWVHRSARGFGLGVRGGSWQSTDRGCAADADEDPPSDPSATVGFRPIVRLGGGGK